MVALPNSDVKAAFFTCRKFSFLVLIRNFPEDNFLGFQIFSTFMLSIFCITPYRKMNISPLVNSPRFLLRNE